MSFSTKVFSVGNGKGAKAAKVQIRRSIAEQVGKPLHVFEAFAGAGILYQETWKDLAHTYVGCDKRYLVDKTRRMFVCDNRRLLRCLDLQRFNLFDLDSYGAPWEQAIIIAARRKLGPGEKLGFVVTEGNGQNYKNGIIPNAVQNLIGRAYVQHTLPGAIVNRMREDIQGRIFSELAKRMGASIVKMLRAKGKSGASVHYIGVAMVGLSDAAAPAAGSGNSRAKTVANPS